MNNVIFEFKLPRGIFKVFNQRPTFDFIHTKQIHSNIIVTESEIKDTSNLKEADGIYGNSASPQCIFTADCIPVVIEGEKGHISLHAGWKGVRDQIVLDEKVQRILPQTILIGPHICGNCYEVKADFKLNFPNSNNFIEKNGKTFFSLEKEISAQILSKYPLVKIISSNECTLENTKYHSYRRDQTKARNYNIYIPNGDLT